MRGLLRTFAQLSINANTKTSQLYNPRPLLTFQNPFSTQGGGGGDKDADWTLHFGGAGSSSPDPMSWDEGSSSWSTGLTKEHFDGEVVGKKVGAPDPTDSQPRARPSGRTQRPAYSDARWTDDELVRMRELEAANRWGKGFVDSWDNKMHETTMLLKQVRIGANHTVFVMKQIPNDMNFVGFVNASSQLLIN